MPERITHYWYPVQFQWSEYVYASDRDRRVVRPDPCPFPRMSLFRKVAR